MHEVSCKHALVGTQWPIDFLFSVESDGFWGRFGVPNDRALSMPLTKNNYEINILSGKPVAPMPLEGGRSGRASALAARTTPSQKAVRPPSRFSQYEGGNAGVEDAAANRSHFRYMCEKLARALPVSRVFPASSSRLGTVRIGGPDNWLPWTGSMVMGS
jgi:hypothetical protein